MVDCRTAVCKAAFRQALIARAVLFLSTGLLAAALSAAEPASTSAPASAAPSSAAPVKKTVHHSRRKHARKSHSAKSKTATPKPAASTAAVPAVAPAPARPAAVAKAAKPAPAASSAVPASSAGAGKPIESRLETFTRSVEVQPGNLDWRKAERKMPLVTSDKVRTGVNATARIKLADGSKVMLLPRSQVEMEAMTTVEKSIRLLRGHLRAIITRARGGNNFKVTTPVGVASVRGTDFEVNVGDDGKDMEVQVFEGQVGVSKLGDLGKEVILNAGDRIQFGAEKEIGDPIRSGGLPADRMEIRSEMQLASAKDNILAMAAEESRNADYQVGKSLIDVNGSRVRVEEYITRPAANEFKLVVLNDRPTRFDYFTYKGTFNTTLPDDLSVALKQIQGKLGDTAPDYFLTGYETVMSNTVDHINETATGGHLVNIHFDGTNYTLTDPTDGSNRTVAAAELQQDGTYKIYNPVKDAFTVVSATDRDEAMKISVLDTQQSYHDLAAGDTYWRTRYNDYTSSIDDVVKTAFSRKTAVTNTLAIDLDADFSNAPIMAVSEFPSGTSSLHNRLSLFYSDGSKTVYDNYIIDDQGQIAPSNAFSGSDSSASFKNELERFNYEQRVTSDEMNGRSIDLVVDPRIGTISGLIQ